jgi:Enoyl-(Acyl carrier protein) reductase
MYSGRELGTRKITVNAVGPGAGGDGLFLNGKAEADVARMASMAPQNRIGQPGEIAEVVAFLASPKWAGQRSDRARQRRHRVSGSTMSDKKIVLITDAGSGIGRASPRFSPRQDIASTPACERPKLVTTLARRSLMLSRDPEAGPASRRSRCSVRGESVARRSSARTGPYRRRREQRRHADGRRHRSLLARPGAGDLAPAT